MRYAVVFHGEDGQRAAKNCPGSHEDPVENLAVVIANAVNEVLEDLLEGEQVVSTKTIEIRDDDGNVETKQEEVKSNYEMVGVQVRLIT